MSTIDMDAICGHCGKSREDHIETTFAVICPGHTMYVEGFGLALTTFKLKELKEMKKETVKVPATMGADEANKFYGERFGVDWIYDGQPPQRTYTEESTPTNEESPVVPKEQFEEVLKALNELYQSHIEYFKIYSKTGAIHMVDINQAQDAIGNAEKSAKSILNKYKP